MAWKRSSGLCGALASIALVVCGCGGDVPSDDGSAGSKAAKDTPAKAAPPVVKAERPQTDATAPTAHKVASFLPNQGPMDVRWAVDLRDRKVVKFWLPPARLTPSLALDIDYVLALTDRNDLIAFRRRSGETLWWTQLTGPLTGDPAFTQFGLYFVVRSNIICLELHSGEVIWHLNLDFPPSAGPAVAEANKGSPVLYVPGLDRKIYALEVEKETWPPAHGVGSVTRDDIVIDKYILRILWRYATYAQVAGNISYYDRQVFAVDAKYNVYAIQSTELAIGMPKNVRLYRTQGPMAVGPTVVGPHLYVPSRDRNLYCLRRRDVTQEWSYASGQLLEEPVYPLLDPFLNRTAIICKSGVSGPLVGLLDTTGEPIWELPGGERVVGLFVDPENELDKRSVMVVRNQDRSISGHYASSGGRVWEVPGDAFSPFCTNAEEEFVFTCIADGQIVCALQKRK